MSGHPPLPPIRKCMECGFRTYERLEGCPDCGGAMPELCARCRETLDEHLFGGGACGAFQEEVAR